LDVPLQRRKLLAQNSHQRFPHETRASLSERSCRHMTQPLAAMVESGKRYRQGAVVKVDVAKGRESLKFTPEPV